MRKLLSVFFGALWLITPGYAQVSTAELSGAITAPSGATIANAKVSAITTATNQSHNTVSSSSGTYVLSLLPPGDYEFKSKRLDSRGSNKPELHSKLSNKLK